MSSRQEIQKNVNHTAMLCPCCGTSIVRGVLRCDCGARFVGEPLDEVPIKVQRLGPAMTSVALLLAVVAAAVVATKWMAVGAVVVIWYAWRAARLARRDPEWYGGLRTATVTLSLAIVGTVALAAYGISYIPRAIDNYGIRHVAATEAAMYHVWSSLEDYKRAFGSYPKDAQEYRKAIGESLAADYWEQSLKYQAKIGDIAEQKDSIERTGLAFNHFELRSAGPDGIIGTDDDVIMRDGIFFTNSDLKKQTAVQQLR